MVLTSIVNETPQISAKMAGGYVIYILLFAWPVTRNQILRVSV